MTGRTDVDAYVATLAPGRRAQVNALRTLIRGAAPGITEEVKWNAPSFRTVESFATLHLREAARIGVILHLGARGKPPKGFREGIPDPDGLLRWLGPDRAMLRFSDAAEVRAHKGPLTRIIRAWVTHVTPNAPREAKAAGQGRRR